MDEKLEQVKELLAKYDQMQLMKGYERLSDDAEKQAFLDSILTIDFNQVKMLYEQAEVKPSFAESKIDPISYIDKFKLSDEEKAHYEELGEKAIKDGKLAVITMAGGQGTRLGHSGPKGTFDLGLDAHKSIFEILTDTMIEATQKYGVDIPWYIMTSEENNDETERICVAAEPATSDEQKNMSDTELGRRLGVSRQTVNAIVKGVQILR